MIVKFSGLISSAVKNKELLLVTLSQVVGLLGSVIFIKLVSHFDSVKEYGLYSLVLSITAFVALFPFTSFDQAISRYISIYHEEKSYSVNYTSILYLYFLMFLVLLMLFTVLYPLIIVYIPTELSSIFDVLISFTVLTIFRTTILQIENFNRNRVTVLFSKMFEGIGRIVLLLILISYYSIDAKGILWISTIIFAVNILIILFFRREFLTFKGLSFELLNLNFKKYYRFSAPLLVWAIFSWLQLYATSWFLQYYRSVEEVGYFNLLNTIAMIIPAQVVGIVGTFIVPIMYQKESIQKGYTKEKTKEIVIYLTLFFLLVFVFMLFFHEFIINILSSSKLAIYSWMLPYLFLSASFSNIAVVFTYEFFVTKMTKELLPIQVLPSIFTIAVSFLMIPSYGIEGALLTNLVTSIVYCFGMMFFYYKVFYYREKFN